MIYIYIYIYIALAIYLRLAGCIDSGVAIAILLQLKNKMECSQPKNKIKKPFKSCTISIYHPCSTQTAYVLGGRATIDNVQLSATQVTIIPS